MKLSLAFSTLLCILGANADIVGEIDVSGETLYVWRQYGSITVQDNVITMRGDCRAYLLQNAVTLIGQDDFYQVIDPHFYNN